MPGYGVRCVTCSFKCCREDRHGQSGKDVLSFKNELHSRWGLWLNRLPVLGKGWGGLGNIFVLSQPQPKAWKLIVNLYLTCIMNDNTNVSRDLEVTVNTCLRTSAQLCLGTLSHVRNMQGGSKTEDAIAQLNKSNMHHVALVPPVGLASSSFRCVFDTLICAGHPCTHSTQRRKIRGPENNLPCLS